MMIMELSNLLPWAALVALIGAAVTIYRLGSDMRAVDADSWADMVASQHGLQQQVNELSAELMHEQARRRETVEELHAQMDAMRQEYEAKIKNYEARIRNLQKRIRELENGKGIQ